MMTIAYRPEDNAEATPVIAPAAPAKPTQIDMASIRVDGGTQSREKLHEETIVDYADAIRDGAKFPPVTVFYDGQAYWLADGFHRHAAHHQAGKKKILAEVRQGSRRDAVLHSVGANANHGLRRTNDDKRRAVLTLLNDPEWSKWSDGEISRQCQVSQPFVSKMRPTVTHNVLSEDRTYTTKHGTEATMNTSSIGKPPAAEPPVEKFDPVQEREITASAPPSDDPFGESDAQGRPFPDPLEDGKPSAEGPFLSSTDDAAEDQSTVNETGDNQYIRGLVHVKIRGFDTFCKEHKAEFVARGVRPDEVASMRLLAGRINKWLEAFLAAAKAGGKA